MATCIHSSRSCLLPFYTIPIFPLLNRKIFHLLVYMKVHVYSTCTCTWEEGDDLEKEGLKVSRIVGERERAS